MSKKHWAYLAIGLALAMLYAIQQVDNNTQSKNATISSLETDLETLGRLGSPNATPYLPYALMGISAWLFFG